MPPLQITVNKAPQVGVENGDAFAQKPPDDVVEAPQAPETSSVAGTDGVCEVFVNGRIYRAWKMVRVNRQYGRSVSEAILATVEDIPGEVNIQPGDQTTIKLAGVQVIKGYCYCRQPAYDAHTRAVQINIASLTMDIAQTSVDVSKNAEYRNQTLETIIRDVLKPFPFNFILRNPPALASKPFDLVRKQYDETVHELVDRLCRMRGLRLTDDWQGNLVGTQIDGNTKDSGGALLVEGQNILRAGAVLNNAGVMAKVYAVSQKPGSDEAYGEAASKVAAVSENSEARSWRVQRLLSEEPGNLSDMQARTDREVAEQVLTSVDVSVTVAGWLRPDRRLWDVTEKAAIYSPMLFPEKNKTLAIRSVTFSQDDRSGTTTTLNLCLPNALSTLDTPGAGPVGSLLNPRAQPAAPAP